MALDLCNGRNAAQGNGSECEASIGRQDGGKEKGGAELGHFKSPHIQFFNGGDGAIPSSEFRLHLMIQGA